MLILFTPPGRPMEEVISLRAGEELGGEVHSAQPVVREPGAVALHQPRHQRGKGGGACMSRHCCFVFLNSPLRVSKTPAPPLVC